MPKTKNSMLSNVVAGLTGIFKRRTPAANRVATLGGAVTNTVGRQPFGSFWLFIKGAPGRIHPGMTCLPQWRWPDKDQYGQAKDGSIRRRTPDVPYRVRRWRKRAAARICKAQGCTMETAKHMVKSIEAGIVRDVIKKAQLNSGQKEGTI